MIKTVYWIRWNEGTPSLDPILSAEWPDSLTNEAVDTLADIRGVPSAKVVQEVLYPEALKLLEAYPMMEMRARLNNCRGPYVVNSEEVPCDEFLIQHALTKRSTTKRGKK